jgi:hypothetical protein
VKAAETLDQNGDGVCASKKREEYSHGTVFGVQKGRLIGTRNGKKDQLCGEYKGGFRYYDQRGKRQNSTKLSWISTQLLSGKEKSNTLMLSKDGSSQPQFPWSRAMRAIWLLNTIEVELNHLGIPLMRVPSSLRDLDDIFAEGTMSEQDRQLIADELSRAYASLAQVVGELQAGMTEIESLLREQPLTLTTENERRVQGV